jgi:replicative DNA helicase
MGTTKFQFDTEFQESIIKYTLTDKAGYKALELYKPEYFDLAEHIIIAQVLKTYYRRKRRVLNNPVVIMESIRKLSKNRKYREFLKPADLKNIGTLLKSLTKGLVKNGDEIIENCMNFARYVELRECLEEVDLEDFGNYATFLTKAKKAINIGSEFTESKGTFLVEDLRARQIARKNRDGIYPLPFRQLNALTNAGGYNSGMVGVILDKPKALKTAMLVNITRMYMQKKKNVIVFDLENGEEQYSQRLEQSIMRIDKRALLEGEFDYKISKTFRKYKRLGVETIVKKLPAYTTTADTLRYWLDFYRNEYGFYAEYMVIDYVGKMGALSGVKDDTQRISDAYVDVDNLCKEYGIIHTWTGHHVKREGYARKATRYRDDDTAKCIDINRHIDIMVGLQQTDEEREQGLVRMEIIVQRDGLPEGTTWLRVHPELQRFDELTRAEITQIENEINQPAPPRPEARPRRTTGDM